MNIARNKRSILLVDDDAAVRDVLRSGLEAEFSMLEVSNCAEVVSSVNHSIDLAIVEYDLPDGNGFDALKTLREKNPALPVIMTTTLNREDILVEAIRKKVTDYIQKPFSLSYLKERLTGIFAEPCALPSCADEGVHEEPIIAGILKFVESNYMHDLRLNVLAKEACMNRFTFSRTFKKEIGQSLVSYLNGIRLRKAVELLERTDLNISEIAFRVGYHSLIHFDRVFKAAYKISPGEYRKG